MISELCRELNNYFEDNKVFEDFSIESNVIAPSIDLVEGQYYRIIGSMFNDGVHRFGDHDLIDESFNGSIWTMRVPPEVVAIAQEIKSYNSSYNVTPFTSESFGGYSYSKATDANGVPMSWNHVFKSKLNKWRKI